MKSTRYIVLVLGVMCSLFSVSCEGLAQKKKENALGPLTDEDPKAWNRRQQWEGQGILGGFQQ